MKRLFLIFLLLFCTGCASTQRGLIIEHPSTPIPFNGSSDSSLSVLRVVMSQPLKNKIIGYIRSGFGGRVQTFHGMDAVAHIRNSAPEIIEELRIANYPVQDNFASLSNTIKKPDLLIEGVVGALEYNVYSIVTMELKSESTANVSWAVFDTHKKEIIYKKVTSGSATGPRFVNVSALTITGVIIDSFRKVLADPNFVIAIQKSFQENASQ